MMSYTRTRAPSHGVLGLLVRLVMPVMLALGLMSLAGCGWVALGVAAAASPGSVSIPAGQGAFAPFILVAWPHTPVTWRNNDSAAHTIATTPDRAAYLNPAPLALTVPAGGSASFTFSAPGLYDYFDPNVATWNASDHRVAAKAGASGYPLAMEGVIWVQGPIAGLPATVTNPIPGKDEFASDFLAIRQGGSVAWYNADTDIHVIAQVLGWGGAVNPATADATLLDGTNDAPPNGQTQTITYLTPGLYYYYCSAHASIQSTWRRAVALPTASERPIPMEAFVLVTPN